jgi:hypothetical protein
MKYRRKPEIVEAEQWFPGDAERDRRLGIEVCVDKPMAWDDTALRFKLIEPANWVVTSPDRQWIYTNEAFRAKFEPVAENTCERCGNSVNERDTCMCEWVDNEAADAFHADP